MECGTQAKYRRDDAQLLDSGESQPQLELLVLRAPPQLCLVVAARCDLRTGLHWLRLAAANWAAGHESPAQRLDPGEPRGPAGEWGEGRSSAARSLRSVAPAVLAEQTEPLSRCETRVLRYLPTNLSTPEIARELSVSVNTVRTHMRHLFAKLSVHRRTEAVTRARSLGLLAPSPLSTALGKCA
jgi:DNA-binding CsgD family transcriptional regulator